MTKPPGPAADALKKPSDLWPARAVEIRPISDLVLRDTNPRAHSLEQIEQICASMREWGWTIPVLVDEENVIIAGHGRVRAARLMGYNEAPVMVARGWSEAQKRAYVVTDNQLAQNSEWDQKRLRSELRELSVAQFDMKLIGFSAEDMTKFMVSPEEMAATQKPTEVTMLRCPTCGNLHKKRDGEK